MTYKILEARLKKSLKNDGSGTYINVLNIHVNTEDSNVRDEYDFLVDEDVLAQLETGKEVVCNFLNSKDSLKLTNGILCISFGYDEEYVCFNVDYSDLLINLVLGNN